MEKTGNIYRPTSNQPRRNSIAAIITAAIFSAYLFIPTSYSYGHVFNINPASQLSPPGTLSDFNWQELPSSKSLDFRPCFSGLFCARLSTPLDWTGTEPKAKGKEVSIAIVKIPARVPITDPRYGGAILLNPGGPGGSGIEFALEDGKHFQQIVDSPHDSASSQSSDTSKYFDIIGFDPRGVNNSTPGTNCFPDDSSLQIWLQRADAQGAPYSNESFANSWSRHASLGRTCSWRLGDDDNEVMGIGRYVSTPSVVKDMRAIVEALGEWREKETKRLSPEVSERNKWKRGSEKLLYIGISYGTLLGATFAAMYPYKIGRMMLDGVVKADDYYAGRWISNVQDADSILESFFRECNWAGTAKCAVFSPNDAENPKKIYEAILSSLQKAPLIVPGHNDLPPDIISRHDLMKYVVTALYSPYPHFNTLATILHDLSEGNGTLLSAIKRGIIPTDCQSPICKQHTWSTQCHNPKLIELTESPTSAILCTDGADIRSLTQEDHYQRWQALKALSSTFGGIWSQIGMPCSNWGIRSVWNFTQDISAANTSHPLLWLTNTRDPVTPMRNAFYMAKKFPGSAVVQQETDGHGASFRPSLCVSKAVRRYFQDGGVPEGKIVCSHEFRPFDGIRSSKLQVLDDVDRKLLETSEAIATSRYRRYRPFGF